MAFPIGVCLNRPSISHGGWDIKLQSYRVTTLTVWGQVTS